MIWLLLPALACIWCLVGDWTVGGYERSTNRRIGGIKRAWMIFFATPILACVVLTHIASKLTHPKGEKRV